jgi:hypothetical protein
MTIKDDPPRLSVVAAIIDADTSGKGALRPEARLGTRYSIAAESQAAASATASEQELAQALQGDQGQRADAQGELAMAALLMLADQLPQADELATGLNQAFLRSDDSQPATDTQPATSRRERRSAFAGLYRRFALHQLNSQVRNKAAAILALLSRP